MAIVDWWIGGGAPDYVRLADFCLIYAFIESRRRYFHDQPLLHPNVTNQHVIIWYFEDWLKKYFLSTVPSDTRGITRNLFPSRASGSRIPQAHSSDALLRARMQSLALIATLCSHPEQEQKLLRL
jgi:ribosome biogenesis protein MAK21